MQLLPNDIIIRQYQGETIWLSQRLVMQVCGVEKEYLDCKARQKFKKSIKKDYKYGDFLPHTGKSWRWGKVNGVFYYDLACIPNQSPRFYRESFGDKDILIANYNGQQKDNKEDVIKGQFNAFLKHTYTDYLHCYADYKEEHRVALAKACAVVEFAVEQKQNPNITGDTIYKEIVTLIEKNELSYLPKNYRVFKQKIEAVINDGQAIADIIRLPREGNSNALVHDDPQLLSWATQMRAMGENYSNEHITRVITENCVLQGKKVPSRRWFGTNVYEKHEVKFLTASKRFGAGSRKAFITEGYIPMQGALHAGDCWQIDASRLNIIAHKREHIDEHGKRTTTDAFLFIIVVRDVHSGDILGWSADYSENRWSVYNALKMAVETAGYLPYELAYDRFPGHNTDEWELLFKRMTILGVKLTKTHKATGKAGVERFFGTLQDVVMQHSKYYYGQGIQSRRKAAHRSPEYLAKIKKEARAAGFDVVEAMNTAENIIEGYRETVLSTYSRKHSKINKSPKGIHSESAKPSVIWVENYDVSMLFGLKKEIAVKHNGTIKTEIHNTEYIYQVSDYGIYSKLDKVIISYDLEDLSQVYLFKPNGDLLIHLGEAEIFNRPVQYGPQAQHNVIAKEKARLKQIEERKEMELEEMTVLADETPLLMGRFTNKHEAEEAETVVLLNDEPRIKTIKKAVGSSYTSNDFKINSKSILNEY
jgi:hypothetical protein